MRYLPVPNMLFWNIKKKDLRRLVCDAANRETADVVILIENSLTLSETLEALKTEVSNLFECPPAVIGRFQLFSRNREIDLQELYSGDRVSFRRLSLNGTELVLGLVHLVDKMNWDRANQQAQVQLLAEEVRKLEQKLGHSRTVLVGDFNMNPFDQAMNIATGMNALMTVKCIERGFRTLQGIRYPYFYNPMWSLFGDRSSGPSGTYYHRTSSKGMYGWNMLDQVLIRPEAIMWFSDVRILTTAGETSLETTLERPNHEIASDHFPVLLSLM